MENWLFFLLNIAFRLDEHLENFFFLLLNRNRNGGMLYIRNIHISIIYHAFRII